MTEKHEHPYVDAPPPPWWVRMSPFLRKLWFNALFQRNYKRGKLEPLLSPRMAFLIGLAYGILSIGQISQYLWFLGLFAQFFILPVIILIIFELGRSFLTCLVSTPRMVKAEIDSDHLNPILAAPIPDRDIFYALTLPNFVRAMSVIEELLIFGLGAVLPYALVMVVSIQPIYSSYYLYGLLYILSLIVGVIFLFRIMSDIAGYYSLTNQVFGAIVGTLIYTFIFSMMPTFAWEVYMMLMIGNYSGGCGVPYLGFFMPFMPGPNLIPLAWMFIGMELARSLGVRGFSKLRRSGFYRPEGATAPGLEEP